MKPEKHGINMGLKNMSDLREFETDRRTDGRTDGQTEGETERQKERGFYQRYYNIFRFIKLCAV